MKKLDAVVMCMIALLGVIAATFALLVWSGSQHAIPAASAPRTEPTAESTGERVVEAVGDAVVEVTITPQPTFTETPSPSPTPVGSIGLTIINNASVPICYVQISPVTSDHWGYDLLGATTIIEVGETVTIGIAGGDMDLRALDCDQNEMSVLYNRPLYDDDRWVVGELPEPTVTLTIINDSSLEICTVYVSPVADSRWGEDWLAEGQTIPVGASHLVENIPAGQYDLAVEDCSSGNIMDNEDGFDLLENSTWILTDN